jgi:CysZ protein
VSSSSGLALGVSSLVDACKRLATTPSLWLHASLPSVVWLVVAGCVLVFGANPLVDNVVALTGVGALDSWYGQTGEVLLSLLLWLTSAVVAVWAAMVVTPPLCAPALEHLVRSEEQRLGAPERARLSIWSEWRCGIQAQLTGFAFSVSVWLLLTAVNVFLPVAVLVTLPLKILAVSSALAWSLLDYPLTLRGMSSRRRLRLFLAQPLSVVGFGLPFALLFWFPCASVLLLPVGALAATRVVWQLAAVDEQWRLALGETHDRRVARLNGEGQR